MEIKQVTIVGLGLIGGTIALGIKRQYPQIKIMGMDKDDVSLNQALEVRAIDKIVHNLHEAVDESQVIFLCTPVKVAIKLLEEIAELPLSHQLILTDVGSTKEEISEVARRKLPEQIRFIGGHPMAGSHKSGFIAADVDLLENAYYVFTTDDQTDIMVVQQLQQLLQGTRAKFIEMSPKRHDEITGMVSHLPHVISSALVHQNGKFSEEHPESNLLAAGGFRDMTRIAASDPKMWTDILMSNKDNLLSLISDWQKQMSCVTKWLRKEDRAAIFRFFEEGKVIRDQLPVFKEGAIPAFHDLFVVVADKPGAIADVTQILAQASISLMNIKIIENREGIMGTLQLTLKNEKDLKRSFKILSEKNHYECHVM